MIRRLRRKIPWVLWVLTGSSNLSTQGLFIRVMLVFVGFPWLSCRFSKVQEFSPDLPALAAEIAIIVFATLGLLLVVAGIGPGMSKVKMWSGDLSPNADGSQNDYRMIIE